MIVASAAPDACISKTPTNRRSNTTLIQHAINTKTKGDRELPIPRKMPLIPL